MSLGLSGKLGNLKESTHTTSSSGGSSRHSTPAAATLPPDSRRDDRDDTPAHKDMQGKAGGGGGRVLGLPPSGGSGSNISGSNISGLSALSNNSSSSSALSCGVTTNQHHHNTSAFSSSGGVEPVVTQRCVIVQRGERGYGLTVTGDKPVYVQEIKENGAAAKAGVQQGDIIMKVNGTLVTNCNHKEVVEYIRSGSYVALTLMGRQSTHHQRGGSGSGSLMSNLLASSTAATTQPHAQSSGPSPMSPPAHHISMVSSESITGPQPVDAEKSKEYQTQRAAIIRTMYDQAATDYQLTKAEYAHNPNEELQRQLNEKRATLNKLEEQLYALTGIPAESQLSPTGLRSPTSPTAVLTTHHPSSPTYAHNAAGGGGPDVISTTSTGITQMLINSQTQYNTELQQQQQGRMDAPWLPGGKVTHRKSGSMPEQLYHLCGDGTGSTATTQPPQHGNVTISRSHSDSRSNKPHVLQAVEMKDSIEQTNSLPSVISSVDSGQFDAVMSTSVGGGNGGHHCGVGGDNVTTTSTSITSHPHQHHPHYQHRRSDNWSDTNEEGIGSDSELSPPPTGANIEVISFEDDDELGDQDDNPMDYQHIGGGGSISGGGISHGSGIGVSGHGHKRSLSSVQFQHHQPIPTSTVPTSASFLSPSASLHHHQQQQKAYHYLGAAPPPGTITKAHSYTQLYEQSPFSDLTSLKHRPAHLAVFLGYLISNDDPASLLFYLVTENFTHGTLKDMRKWAYEIYSTFLLEQSPLRVTVSSDISAGIDTVITTKYEGDSLRTVFQLARHSAQTTITEQLADFRNKQSLGLGSMYGDHELQDGNMDKQAELRLVERCLGKHFDQYIKQTDDRSQAMAAALSTVMKSMGCGVANRNSLQQLDRCQSFVAKDKRTFLPKAAKKKAHMTRGHHFQPTSFYTVTHCHVCGRLFWGAGLQGYACIHCEVTAHKACTERVEMCAGKKAKRNSRFMDKIRKPSTNSASAIREATQQQFEETYGSVPGGASTVPGGSGVPGSLSHSSLSTSSLPISSQSSSSHHPHHTLYSAISQSSVLPRLSREYANSIGIDQEQQEQLHNTTADAQGDAGGGTATTDLGVSHSVNNLVSRFESRGGASIGGAGGGVSSGSSEDLRSPTTPGGGLCIVDELEQHTLDRQDNNRASGTSLSRSESLNKGKSSSGSHHDSKKNVRRHHSDVQMDEQALKQAQLSHSTVSSSTSSISVKSGGSLESPSSSLNDLHLIGGNDYIKASSDSDLEVESELPSLEHSIPKDQLKKLKGKDKKKQEVINELFHTERTHVRNLKIMHLLFYQPLRSIPWVSQDHVKLWFPNIEDMIRIHSKLNQAMKAKKKSTAVVDEVADIFLESFSGDAGVTFQRVCAACCRDQSHALEVLKRSQRKDQKLANFLHDQHSNPSCRRLELKDLIPTLMQRLTKYPLLIEKILHYTPVSEQPTEHDKLKECLQYAKRILDHVNLEVQNCENRRKLTSFQRRLLDRRPLENTELATQKLDLRDHNLLYEGVLTLRIGRSKPIELQVVLLEDMMVLLSKQADDKLVLKYLYATVQTGKEEDKVSFSPIISYSGLITRDVATDKRSFFLLTTSNNTPLMYQLSAHSVEERKRWLQHIRDAAESYKTKENRTNATSGGGVGGGSAAGNKKDHKKHAAAYTASAADKSANRRSADLSSRHSGTSASLVSSDTTSLADSGISGSINSSSSGRPSITSITSTATITANDQDAGDISDRTSCLSVDTLSTRSDSVFESAGGITPTPQQQVPKSPLDTLKAKDELIAEALKEKQKLVGEVFDIPAQHVQHIAEIASEVDTEKDVKELILASIYEGTRLGEIVNNSLNVPEETRRDTGKRTSADLSGAGGADGAAGSGAIARSQSQPEAVSASITGAGGPTSDLLDNEEPLTPVPESDSATPVSPTVDANKQEIQVTLPSSLLIEISTKLNNHLRELLSVVHIQEEENKRLEEQLKQTQQSLAATAATLMSTSADGATASTTSSNASAADVVARLQDASAMLGSNASKTTSTTQHVQSSSGEDGGANMLRTITMSTTTHTHIARSTTRQQVLQTHGTAVSSNATSDVSSDAGVTPRGLKISDSDSATLCFEAEDEIDDVDGSNESQHQQDTTGELNVDEATSDKEEIEEIITSHEQQPQQSQPPTSESTGEVDSDHEHGDKDEANESNERSSLSSSSDSSTPSTPDAQSSSSPTTKHRDSLEKDAATADDEGDDHVKELIGQVSDCGSDSDDEENVNDKDEDEDDEFEESQEEIVSSVAIDNTETSSTT